MNEEQLRDFVFRGQAAQHAIDALGAGKPDDAYVSLIVKLGTVTGLLQVPALRERLIAALRDGSLDRGYVELLRDALTQALTPLEHQLVRALDARRAGP